MEVTNCYDIYVSALNAFGERTQMIVALEELSECQKEICKMLRGEGNVDHLAEEIADAQIMLEQITMIFQTQSLVTNYREMKLLRLEERTRRKKNDR